ncbi:MAG TPA: thioredoxin family protein, partial [Candidatus Wirthbacteria bacterium]|nr:thioredoxin family protein [Candidatus Wirthbacteria bacterium]
MRKIIHKPYLKIITLLFLLLGGLAFSSRPLWADSEKHPTTLYLFWGNGCAHCKHEKDFLKEIQPRYPELIIRDYEVWYDRDNANTFQKMAEAFDFQAGGVPATFIGDFEPITGFGTAQTTGAQIEEYVKYCINNGCNDPGSRIGIAPAVPERPNQPPKPPVTPEDRVATLPLIGTIDVGKTGILVFTIIVGII